jgi:hypothetical protein
MELPKDINEYLRSFASELGERILQTYPPMQSAVDAESPFLDQLLRKPFPAQSVAILGVAKRWQGSRSAAVIAECGTGKTLISLGAIHAHSRGRSYNALAMVPPQLVEKWAREAIRTLPRVRVFLIDSLRNDARSAAHAGINEVRLRGGRIVREGLKTTLTELRLRKTRKTPRDRWNNLCGSPAVFIVGRERGKLSYFWRHVCTVSRSGRFRGNVVNPDNGSPIFLGDDGQRLLRADFKKAKLSEMLGRANGQDGAKSRRALYSPLWQADEKKTHRVAPIDFIGRYMSGFFDYAIADEVHELKGDTAQGNALGTLAGCARHIVVLTGTLLGGYADDLFNILFRLDAAKMVDDGFEHGESGVRAFTETYGLLENITVIEPADNACSEARVTKRVRRRPGASPLLFGRFLMSLGAFISLEDISEALPPYREEVISVEMDAALREAYQKLEEDVKSALKEHRGNQSVMSIALNALLLYPDRPFHLGSLYGSEYDPETQQRERFLIAEPANLDEEQVYAKEAHLVNEVKTELAQGRRCQIYAVYTQKRDVTRRLERILSDAGIRTALLTRDVAPELREAWYERQLRAGVEAVICHPKLVQTGLDLIEFPTIIFYETGYSIYVLRQASRRSWRIGQRRPVKVKFLHYANTMQETCLKLMGKKLLVSLAMEGKFSAEGLQAIDETDDILMAMARELVTEKGIGERADAVWAALQRKQEESFGGQVSAEDAAQLICTPTLPNEDSDSDLSGHRSPIAPALEQVPARNARRVLIPDGQLSLF